MSEPSLPDHFVWPYAMNVARLGEHPARAIVPQRCAGIWVGFDADPDSKPCGLEPEVEATGSGEQREHRPLILLPRSSGLHQRRQ
jgi:hypothetical protein